MQVMPKSPRRVLEVLTELEQKNYITELYPSHEYIASKLGYCRLTIIRAMKWLRINKFISWVGRVLENGWCQTSNLYTILKTIPDDSSKIDEVTETDKPELQNVTRKIKHLSTKYKHNNINCKRGEGLKTAIDFMQQWHGSEKGTFQIIPETDQSKQLAETTRKYQKCIFHGQISELYFTLKKFNDMGYSIHVAVNSTDFQGRRIENVKAINGYVLDLDGGSIDYVIEKTQEHDIEPSMIVQTSPGRYHVYWKTDSCPLDKWRGIQETIANYLDGDPASMSLNKTLRMPGFNHLKKQPYPVRIIHSSCSVLPFLEANRLFPAKIVKPRPINEKFKPTGKMWDNPIYGESEGNRDDALFKFICRVEKFGLTQCEAEYEAVQFAQACTPPLPDNDAIRKVDYVWRRYR